VSVELDGLDGRNPMAYFAAVGTLIVADRMLPNHGTGLSWRRGPIPRPVLHGVASLDELTAIIESDRKAWTNAMALTFEGADDVKFDAAAQRRYLRACRGADDGGRSVGLAAALLAEGVFAGKGDGKPTDLHFTAGQQRFLASAREVMRQVSVNDLNECLVGPWKYDRQVKTLGWDVSDDRVYALTIANPAKEVKLTVPGADWLALMGLVAFPVVADGSSSSPAGSTGSWKHGAFTWGVWSEPLGAASVRALLANGWSESVRRARVGLFQQFQSAIRRSEQGGYGSFGPSSVVWQEP